MHGLIIMLLALAASPLAEAEPIVDDVAVLEHNTFCDPESGKLVFEQLIAWDWNPIAGEYTVVAWRLVKGDGPVCFYTDVSGRPALLFTDGDVLRKVRAECVCKTVTLFDPELSNREILPKEKRREFSRRKQVTNGH